MKSKVQDLIDAKEIEFGAPEKPKQEAGVNAIRDDEEVEESQFDSWIYPTADSGPRNWIAKDHTPVTFVTQ